VALDPLSAGTTTVSAAATGFDPTYPGSSQLVTVTPTELIVFALSGDTAIGSGLQALHSVFLNGSAHGGVTVRVASSTPSAVRVSDSPTTVGGAFVDLFVPDGSTTASFWAQGLGAAGTTSTLTASQASFVPGTLVRDVVQPALRIDFLPTSVPSSSADVEFAVTAGIPTSPTSLLAQSVLAATTLTIASTAPSVGELVTPSASGGSVTVQILQGQTATPFPGSVAFAPLSEGTTTVSAAAAGFNPAFLLASVEVTVTP
jgi:hypothetical protein